MLVYENKKKSESSKKERLVNDLILIELLVLKL